jgi:hypothetical protein
MLESPSGRFPRFIWPDPTRPFANASLRLERVVSQRPGAPSTPHGSGLVATITAMAGHLRAWGESREGALAAIRQELETALAGDHLPAGQAWTLKTLDEVVRLAIDSCYGAAEPPARVASPPPPKPVPRRRRASGSLRRRNDSKPK